MSAKLVLQNVGPNCSRCMRLLVLVTIFLRCLTELAHSSETNVLIIPAGDKRAGRVYFVDECLTRGLTNSISLSDLRKWATNTAQLYQRKEAELTSARAIPMRYFSVLSA